MTPVPPFDGYVMLNSWAGLTRHDVDVLRETPKKYVIRWRDTALGHTAGQTRYVNKGLVRFERKVRDTR